jgi:hypothetical protein
MASHQGDACSFEPGDLARIIPVTDELIASFKHCGNIEFARHCLSRTSHALSAGKGVTRTEHRL